MKTVLVISGGGFQGLTLVRALQQRSDVHVIICDIFPENPTRYLCLDYRTAPPISNLDAFSRFVLDTAKQDHVDVIFPATARELPALSRLKAELESIGTRVAVSGTNVLDILLDKLKTYEWLQTAGLPVQETFDPADCTVSYPLLGRPRNGWGGRGLIAVYNAEELQNHHNEWATHIWTRWLSGFDEFSLDFAIGLNGDVSPIVLRRRLRVSGGFSLISESVTDAPLFHLAKRAAQALSDLGGRGLFNIQVLATNDCEYLLSDVNPRSGTSATHALAEGINLPGFFVDSTTAGTAIAPVRRKKVRTIRLLQDIYVPQLANAPKGAVFDLDDTLVDHKLWMLKKIEATHPHCFAKHVDRSRLLLCAAQLIDEGIRSDLIDRLLSELSLPDALRAEAIGAYREAVVADTPLYNDAAQILLAFKSKGFPVAIVTDNPPATQRSKVANANALNCVDTVIYTREHGYEKPHRSGFIQAARSLALDPSQLVMVGDNYFRDGVGAVRAGYLHALIIRRTGGFINHHDGMTRDLSSDDSDRIDVVDSLLTAYHACVNS